MLYVALAALQLGIEVDLAPGPEDAPAARLVAASFAAFAAWAWSTSRDARLPLPSRLGRLALAGAASSAALLAASVAAWAVGAPGWLHGGLTDLAVLALAGSGAASRTRLDAAAAGDPQFAGATVAGAIAHAFAGWPTQAAAGVVRWRQGLRDRPQSGRMVHSPGVHEGRTSGRRGLLVAVFLVFLAAVLANGLLGYHVGGVVVSRYAAVTGLSLLLASTPGIVLTWLILVTVSGRPRIAASLQMAGDYSGRGLVCGFVVGITGFALDHVADRTSSPALEGFRAAEIGDWLALLLTLSAAGTMIGFALSQLRLLDLACQSWRYPKIAWLAAPPLIFVVQAVLGADLLDARRIYLALATGLTRGLAPVPPGGITEDLIVQDARYAFAVDQTNITALIPDPVWLAGLWGAAAAVFLWGMEWRGSARASSERASLG
ncbi:hypothetical protein [Sinomonas sp. P10A9]|uniref:Uncharacterized protein n=1 Tax=Sinomonas puerhi TaxID=3238584 RepID=A0AB39L6E8_9MICC